MASPTPLTLSKQDGDRYYLTWHADFTGGAPDDFTDTVIIDRSALSPAASEIEIIKAVITCTAGVDCLLEWEHSSGDVFLTKTVIGNTEPQEIEIPRVSDGHFAFHGLTAGVSNSAASDGDLILTTTSAAASDVVHVQVYARLRLS